MPSSSKLARLGALLVLATSLGAEALHLNFKRTPVPEHAKAIWSRNTLVTRTAPSRMMKRALKVLKRQNPDDAPEEPEEDEGGEGGSSSNSTSSEILQYFYTAPITVGGKEYTVVLDTSNEDLLLDHGPEDAESGDIRVEFDYETPGPVLKIDGTVGFAPLTFGTYEIPLQAYLDIEDETDDFYDTFGFNGFFGLGLETATAQSKVDQAVKAAEGEDSTRGQTVLQNIFDSQPDAPRFIALDLARKDDMRDIDNFEISFGEYPEAWSEIEGSPKIPLYPEDADTWNILIDKITLDDFPLTMTSSLEGVKAGKAVAHITASQPLTVLPIDLFDELYGNIEDSASFFTEKGEKRWLVPCLSYNILTLTAGGVTIFIHPLDISSIWTELDGKPEALADYTVCVSAFRGVERDQIREDVDIVLGASFLRNVQTIFGFPVEDDDGTVVEPAYFQMQADTEDIKMEAQVESIRGAQMEELPEELEPSEAVKLLSTTPPTSTGDDDDDDVTATATATADEDDSEPTPADGSKHGHHATPGHHGAAPTPHGGSRTFAKTGDSSDADESEFKKHLPVVLGLLGANILVGLVLMVLGILNYIKKGAARRTGAHVYVPVGKSDS